MADDNNELHRQSLEEKTKECEKLREKSRKLKFKVSQLEIRLKEAESQPYRSQSLPRQRRNGLESADLQKVKDQAMVEATEKLQAKFDEELAAAVAAERAKWEQEMEATQKQFEDKIRDQDSALVEAREELERLKATQEGENNRLSVPNQPKGGLDSSSSESELQKMAQQISQVSQQQASLHDSLRDNSGSIEQIRNLMRERQAEMKKKLADKDAELGEKTEQCETLLGSSEQMKTELARLRTREEEWQQTSADYQKLKNQYNLLTNTKERLESEKADLQRSRDETLAAETQKLQAKFDEERSAAVEAERDKWQQELAELQANHAAEVKALQLELTGAKKENEGNLQAAQAENERALTSERERCRAEADRLVAEHASAIEAMRKEFEEKIREQERLTEEARRELQELSEKHEAEKAEMFELVKQFGLSSFSTDNFRSNDAGTMTDSSAETLKLAERISLGSSGARAGQGAETSTEAQSQPASIDSFCFLSQSDVLLDSVKLRKKASSMAKELLEARSQLQQSSEYAENFQRCSHQVDAANCDLYKEIEGHKKQISTVSQVAEEMREKFISEARRVAKLETKLASLRQENSELQCRDATLRLAQVNDASEIASLNRRLDEAKRGLAQAAETADLANKKLEETRLEMVKLKAKYQSVKQELLKAQRGT
ncbi:hypothetical protein BOX15_Mlig010584g1 [Macrostomum lignano]|uniref:Uncharacterized protein n=1 Tax=Macrostomum lignano TaxID=282301 RepID=A0A267FBI9_9PLAT|nr:hypothetical protein BOX15_Mlig010584g1 [Macrostomum lignano]